eukprot:CAMPEP_0197648718 /NCGR_PEP_ID=MMETSP1338-20131121/27921_1 /TAXON_ID=43686 ORGANISM="Pelagodinium beii, Strain RCC1491" /NCGR_SAMPLE_ID=MMETSP1338 /ASSEMBLY_ACC=CAM_ASM_000754 /LENGTH=393 /DNA_ID=CAMNT_0043222767 /DNA_START=52 /DNA_END=1233 /DNA_ORIENTATION=+
MRAALFGLSLALVSAVPQFDVNLDAAPAQRWQNVTSFYREDILAMTAQLQKNFEQFSSEARSQWHEAIEASMLEEHKAELQGIVDDMKSDTVSMEVLLLFNALYELSSSTACSGMLAAAPDGRMIHGRNMDYSFIYPMPNGTMHDLPDVTFDVTWWKKGQKLMTSVQWPMWIGLHTAMRFDGWTFEQNTRPNNDAVENLKILQTGGKLFGPEVRSVMESVPSFNDAVETLNATNFASPMYMVLAGAGDYEGAVITIDRGGKRLPGTPPVQHTEKASGSWHLLQTNDDLDKPAEDPRRPMAEMLLKQHEQSEVSEDFVWQTVRGLPLYVEKTAFSWVASPKTGYFRTIIHSEPPPVAGSVKLFEDPLQVAGHKSLKRRKLFKNHHLKVLSSRSV